MTARRKLLHSFRQSDDDGSIALLLMVCLVGLSLSALLVPTIIAQSRTTRFDSTRVQALHAAQAGIDVMLGNIRLAATAGIGDSSKLPCGPITGDVSTLGLSTYSVSIQYFMADPVQSPTATTMTCVAGFGTYDAPSGASTPSFARLTSTGSAGTSLPGSSAGRTLVSTYVFKTSNTNIAGGSIRIYPDSTAPLALCIDAGSSTPSAGITMSMRACGTSTLPITSQIFAYRNDLTLLLVSSVTSAYPNGLCLATAAPPTAGAAVLLAACLATGTTPPYTQQWSFNDNGQYQMGLSTSKTDGVLGPPNLCMNVASQTALQPVKLATCAGGPTDTAEGWIPTPSVGAGAAALPQWINYEEFGRCLDVTDQNTSSSHLIDFPCKQNPFAGAVLWNQKFTATVIPTGQTSVATTIYTSPGGSNYCLTSPGTSGGYVTVVTNGGQVTGGSPCGTARALQTWTVYGGDVSLPYSTKYTIRDSNSLCLGLTEKVGTETWSAIDVEPCTGATDQKWNASPNVLQPFLQNTYEK